MLNFNERWVVQVDTIVYQRLWIEKNDKMIIASANLLLEVAIVVRNKLVVLVFLKNKKN